VKSDWYSVRNSVSDWKGPVHALLESCSGAAAMADELTLHAGWSVQLAHPGYVSRVKQSHDKTDKTDGRVLADHRSLWQSEASPQGGGSHFRKG